MTEPIKQPEPLRLADALSGVMYSANDVVKAAALLRTQHAQLSEWEAKATTWLLSPEAATRLDGYVELGAMLAKAEAERDEAIRDHDAVVQRYMGEIQCLTEERNETRSELARLTTLRPIASLPPNTQCLRWTQSRTGQHWMLVDKHDWHDFWTPLPPVKEADK